MTSNLTDSNIQVLKLIKDNLTEPKCRNRMMKYIEMNLEIQELRLQPDLSEKPKVNPLDLKYFMSATIVMSFGLVFLIISLTWMKLV